MTELLPCPFCGGKADFVRSCFAGLARTQWRVFCTRCQVRQLRHPSRPAAARVWNRRAPVAVPAAAKPSTCCPGEHLVPMHSTDTKLCTGCKTEKHWPLEPGQKRTY